MKANMTQATWNSWAESPKSANLKHELIKRCMQLGIQHTITSEPLNRSFLDKLCGVDKEMIYFNLKGSVESLTLLQSELQLEN